MPPKNYKIKNNKFLEKLSIFETEKTVAEI